MDLAALVDAYWQHYRRTFGGKSDPDAGAPDDYWANEAAWRVASGERAGDYEGLDPVVMLLALADAANDVRELAYLGAGPVEDYLQRAAPDLDAIDTAARRHEKFRTALRCAWFEGRLAPADASRLRRFGDPL